MAGEAGTVGESITLSFDITNTGQVDAEETVRFYLSPTTARQNIRPSIRNFPQNMDIFTYGSIGAGGNPISNRDYPGHDEDIWVGYRRCPGIRRKPAMPLFRER